MEPIIPPVALSLVESELRTVAHLVRQTNHGGNEIYSFVASEAPHLMREVGRLREEAFRDAGGGTGQSLDIDQYDTAEQPFTQLIVWDPQVREILGGYRYIVCSALQGNDHATERLATSHLFGFSTTFMRDYFPRTVELGRSFVQPKYQSSRAGARALYALDNLWDGLGAIVSEQPQMRYFFGKVTMYTSYDATARNLIMGFWQLYFPATREPGELPLIWAHKPLPVGLDPDTLHRTFQGGDFRQDYRTLVRLVRERGENIPPLVNAYMMLSPTMRSYGTAINDEFGDVEETAILIDVNEVYPQKAERHIQNYAAIVGQKR